MRLRCRIGWHRWARTWQGPIAFTANGPWCQAQFRCSECPAEQMREARPDRSLVPPIRTFAVPPDPPPTGPR